jgi:hypothetical protein
MNRDREQESIPMVNVNGRTVNEGHQTIEIAKDPLQSDVIEVCDNDNTNRFDKAIQTEDQIPQTAVVQGNDDDPSYFKTRHIAGMVFGKSREGAHYNK